MVYRWPVDQYYHIDLSPRDGYELSRFLLEQSEDALVVKTTDAVLEMGGTTLPDLNASGRLGGTLDLLPALTHNLTLNTTGPELLYRHSPGVTIAFILGYLAVFLIGLVGNSLVIAVVIRSPRMRNVTNYFIVNLAVADMLVITLCLPATLMANIYVPWIMGLYMCKIVPYVQGVSVAASVYSLVAVSVDRFLAIWWPLKTLTTRRARVFMFLIWVFALSVTIPWAMYFEMIPVFQDQPGTMVCAEVWPDPKQGNLFFLIANVLMCYILPTILITLCYLLIWLKVSKRDIPTDTKDAQMERIQQKSKVKVIKMLIIVVIIFVVSWAPLYFIFTVVKFFNVTPSQEEALHFFAPIAQWLGSSNSCINPILYAFFNKKFRRGFIAILKSKRCCSTIRYYETVALANSSSASMRKSSYYVNNGSGASIRTHYPPTRQSSFDSFRTHRSQLSRQSSQESWHSRKHLLRQSSQDSWRQKPAMIRQGSQDSWRSNAHLIRQASADSWRVPHRQPSFDSWKEKHIQSHTAPVRQDSSVSYIFNGTGV